MRPVAKYMARSGAIHSQSGLKRLSAPTVSDANDYTSATALKPVPEDPIRCIVESAREPGLIRERQQPRSAMKVKDAMHKGVDWVSPDTPVTELAKLMREHDIGAIPIGENDRLIGMVTDRDIVCKGLAQDSFDATRATARDVMTPGIHCCRDDDDLAKAVRHMEQLQVRRLPVINKSKRMVGILSLGDVSNSAPGDLLSECVKSVSAHH
jgi:CBS domain-containing protein